MNHAPAPRARPAALAWPWLPLGAVVYAALFAAYSWPLSREAATAFVGLTQGDANQYVWNAYNFQRQAAAGYNPFFTRLLLYPEGISLWMHTYTPVLGLLNLLLRQEILAVNLGLLLSFGLSGLGAARLAGRWIRQPGLCLLVGLVFAFSPYKLAHWPEHYHLLLTATVPFYISAFLSAFAFEAGRLLPRVLSWAQVAWCAGLGFITLLSDYYTLAGLLYFSAGYAAWFGLRLGQINWRHPRAWLGLGALLLACHLVSRLLSSLHVPDNAGLWWGGDLAGYLVPPLGNRWLATAGTDAFWRSARFNMPGSVENVTFLGYVLPFLALVLWWRRRRESPPEQPLLPADARPLWALALLFLLLTMPELRLAGHRLLRLPSSLVHYIPFLNNIRCPTRHVLLLSLLLPLATLISLDNWLALKSAALRWGLALALTGLVLLEFQPQAFPLVRAGSVPRAYEVAAAGPGAALFPIPFGLLDGYRQRGQMNPAELFYQTRHHRALPGAYVSRVPAATFDAFDRDPVLASLLLLQQHPDTLAPPAPSAAQLAAFLRRYQPAAFVVRPDYRQQPAHAWLRAALGVGNFSEEEVDGYLVLRPRPGASPVN